MSFRERIKAVLELSGFRVVPWGHTPGGQFVMVRPAGTVERERTAVEVWCVNPPSSTVTDPDDGLEEHMLAVYRVLRTHVINPDVTPASYEVNRTSRSSNAHAAMVITAISPAPI